MSHCFLGEIHLCQGLNQLIMNEQSIEIADNERDLSETVVGEPLAVEELIDEKEPVSPVAGIVASSY